NNSIKQNLLELSEKLKDEETVEFYTDEAIVANSKGENRLNCKSRK
ncbi:373_t:CDS:1, partial [Scutellospora calospora]